MLRRRRRFGGPSLFRVGLERRAEVKLCADEVDHVDESLIIARFISDSEEGIAAAREGMDRAFLASWSFLNGLYRLCYANI